MSSDYGKISSGASGFDPYSNKKLLQGTTDFLQSNSLVAKISFLILVIFLFVIILRMGISLLNGIFSNETNPILIKGVIPADNLVVISQNPKIPGSTPILRSTNQRDGLEFTWSTWVWIKTPSLNSDPTSRPNQYKHIFSKGNDIIDSNGLATPNNAPGLYISPNGQDLVVIMNTFDTIREEIVIGDIPIEKWINVIIRCNQHTVDVFINGMLTQSHTLKGVPKQNYDNVYVGLNGGFNGNISQLQYFSHAIGTNKIQSIVENGPNLKVIIKQMTDTKPYYLSFRWFFPERPNQIN